jgi:hypothetical protein
MLYRPASENYPASVHEDVPVSKGPPTQWSNDIVKMPLGDRRLLADFVFGRFTSDLLSMNLAALMTSLQAQAVSSLDALDGLTDLVSASESSDSDVDSRNSSRVCPPRFPEAAGAAPTSAGCDVAPFRAGAKTRATLTGPAPEPLNVAMPEVDTGAADAVCPVSGACLAMEPCLPCAAAPDPPSLDAPPEVSAGAPLDASAVSPVDPSWTTPAKAVKQEKSRRRLDTRPALGARGGVFTSGSSSARTLARTILRSGKTLSAASAMDG